MELSITNFTLKMDILKDRVSLEQIQNQFLIEKPYLIVLKIYWYFKYVLTFYPMSE